MPPPQPPPSNPHPPSSSTAPFTPAQQNAQARGKPFDTTSDAIAYEQRQRAEEAAAVLESVEMLMWHAAARNESVPQTRAHFTNVVLGLPAREDDVVWREEWEVDVEERSREGGEVPTSPRGKDGGGASAGGSGSGSGSGSVKGKGKRRVGEV